MTRALLLTTTLLSITVALGAQAPARLAGPGLDMATIGRIRTEALTRSQAVDHVWWLSEVHGPRATGTPGFEQASNWVMRRFNEWGLKNVHQERFAFGQGWSIERFSVHLVAPQTQTFVGAPRWNSPSTNGPVLSDVVQVKAASEADLAKYRGQLKGKIVVMQPVRAVRMLDGRIILRMGDEEWKEAMETPIDTGGGGGGPSPAQRAAQQFAGVVQRFLVSEGAAVLLERGSDALEIPGGSDLSWMQQRVDGGTIFPGNGGNRDASVPQTVPSATLAVEHYNRIVRLLDHEVPVRMEVNIQTKFYPEAPGAGNGINTIGEIPGTDLADEVVILGAHMDSYPYAGGATDNGTGSAAMMEAVRVIATLGLKPRRTIRVALWAGEEQGLLGSRAYVQSHYFDGAPKPGSEKVSAYFNLDNGGGKVRGVYAQENLGVMPIFERWIEPLRDLGVTTVTANTTGATDHVPFDRAGLPGFQFIQDELDYGTRTHHTNADVFDHLSKDDLMQGAVVLASFIYHTAQREELLPRKPLPRND